MNATTTIFDTDAQGQPLLLRSDDYGSSGAAVYTSGSGGSSWVWPASVWQIHLGNQTLRKVFLTLASQGRLSLTAITPPTSRSTASASMAIST